ncbi:MAG: hypothetical protein JF612_03475, partial [Planctomycetia bacterium]|nr:hypothetical protein [Planctomycetia bacterium]
MIDSCDLSQPLDEVEALIRSAGEYVHASDDLRPRVLENARLQCRERRLRRRFWQSAAVVLFCGLFTSSLIHRAESAMEAQSHTAACARPMLAPVEVAARSSDPSWQMVES